MKIPIMFASISRGSLSVLVEIGTSDIGLRRLSMRGLTMPSRYDKRQVRTCRAEIRPSRDKRGLYKIK